MQSSNNSKRGRGAPKGNSNARRHGFYARKLAHSAPEAVIAGDGAHVAGSPPDEAGFSLPASASLLVSGARVSGAPAPIPTLDDLILELYAKQKDLSAYIAGLSHSQAPDDESRVSLESRKLSAFELFRQNTATLGRLLAYRGQGDLGRELTGALNQVLDMMSRDLGMQL